MNSFLLQAILMIFAIADYWAIVVERPTDLGVPNAWHSTIVYSHVFAFYQLLLGMSMLYYTCYKYIYRFFGLGGM